MNLDLSSQLLRDRLEWRTCQQLQRRICYPGHIRAKGGVHTLDKHVLCGYVGDLILP
jgi:hypothetical protein